VDDAWFLDYLFGGLRSTFKALAYSNGNAKFENFMHVEWCEEKFLKGIVGDKTRLRF